MTCVLRHLGALSKPPPSSTPSSSSSTSMISAAAPPSLPGSNNWARSISRENQRPRRGLHLNCNGGAPVSLKPEKKGGAAERERRRMWVLCGFGYWVQGFRCFPWLALNFRLVHDLGFGPSALQLVQTTANLPMVAKPLHGFVSDAISINGAHRLPYISIGVFLQVSAWVFLVMIPASRELFPAQMACILLGNIGASVTEVAGDALLAEFSKEDDAGHLQSCSFMALAAGGMMGNLIGGITLARTRRSDFMFVSFSLLLAAQLVLALTSKESDAHRCSASVDSKVSSLVDALANDKLRLPLTWIVVSTATIPLLSGSIFFFQTRSLKLDAAVIGLSRFFGHMIVLFLSFFYNRRLKSIPLRKLVFWVQLLYAVSLLSDLILVKQINVRMGISNEIYVLFASAMAEAVAQFRVLPFSVLLAGLCPSGCEGSLFAIFGSAICLSTIVGGVFGVGLAALVGAGGGESNALCAAVAVQFVAALAPLGWISSLPIGD